MFLVVLSCVLTLGFGQRISIICGDYKASDPNLNSLFRSQIRRNIICASLCSSVNTCVRTSRWFTVTCPNIGKTDGGKTKTSKNGIGSRCRRNETCTAHNKDYICFEGKCLCKVGLSLDRDGRCVRSVIGSRCRRNETCTAYNKDYLCFEGKCLCKVGLSLDRDGRCVRTCKQYGSSFTTYTGYSTAGHNTEVHVFTKFPTCKKECLQTRRFKCLSVEMGNKKVPFLGRQSECHLGNESFLDVPKKDQFYGDMEYSFSTRNCKGARIIR